MERDAFRRSFGTTGPVVLPVIHVLDARQTLENVRIATACGCPGVFLINHDFPKETLLPVIEEVRGSFPDAWLGVNFLAVTGRDAFPILGQLRRDGISVDGYWADDACIDERLALEAQAAATAIAHARAASGWRGLYFGGTAFKKQRAVASEDLAESARIACHFMEVVTTSGVATGKAADLSKIETFRAACGDRALAIASGITPENAESYRGLVDCFMVATGINIEDDFTISRPNDWKDF